MFSRRDRFELGVLGLMLLGWALLVVPLLHARAHQHGQDHAHSTPTPAGTSHGAGSVEHLLALAIAGPAVPHVTWVGHRIAREESTAPAGPYVARWKQVAVPQGP